MLFPFSSTEHYTSFEKAYKKQHDNKDRQWMSGICFLAVSMVSGSVKDVIVHRTLGTE
jgi:hypothetical protein